MWCFRGCGRQLPCKALSCVPLVVIFWPLFMATTVTARMLANVSRSVSSAVQGPLLTDELTALGEIAKALNRNVDLLSNNWSWIKVGLLSFGVLFLIEILKIFTGVYTGVHTQYLVDRRREAMVDPLAASANQVADPRAQQPAASNRMVTTADADREENQTNREVDRLEEGLKKDVVSNLRFNSPYENWPRLEPEATTEKGKEALSEGRDDHYCVCIEDGKQVS